MVPFKVDQTLQATSELDQMLSSSQAHTASHTSMPLHYCLISLYHLDQSLNFACLKKLLAQTL